MNKYENNNNKRGKLKDFLKKEKFYVGLFLMVCILGTVAGVQMVRNNNALVTSAEDNNDAAGEKDVEANAKAKSESVEFAKSIDGEILIPYLGDNGMYPTKEGAKSTLGVYIEAKEDVSVKAVADGKVESVGEDTKGNGTMVVVDHGNGYKTVYANLGETSVKKGDEVKLGKKIATTGTTTKYTQTFEELTKNPTALYFQVLKEDSEGNFVDVDPQEYVKDLKIKDLDPSNEK